VCFGVNCSNTFDIFLGRAAVAVRTTLPAWGLVCLTAALISIAGVATAAAVDDVGAFFRLPPPPPAAVVACLQVVWPAAAVARWDDGSRFPDRLWTAFNTIDGCDEFSGYLEGNFDDKNGAVADTTENASDTVIEHVATTVTATATNLLLHRLYLSL
jgi:hypothetical protein